MESNSWQRRYYPTVNQNKLIPLTYLLLSVFFSTGLFVIFKYFGVYKITVLKAIVVNYIVAFILGFSTTNTTIEFAKIPYQPWFLGALVLGAMFVSVFFVMAMATQKNGISVTSIAGKMSVVVPIFFGIFLYHESVTFLKISAILTALVAVYLASVKKEDATENKAGLLFPVLLFFGSGAIDTTLKFVEVNYVAPEDVAIFSGSLFAIAAIFGSIVLLITTKNNRKPFGIKNIVAGIILGVPNYYSIVFLIKALQTNGFESSILFTINNVAIVIVSTLVGFLFFKEHFSTRNKIGIFFAIFAIVLITIT